MRRVTALIWFLVAGVYLFFLLRRREGASLFATASRWAGVIFAVSLFGLYLGLYLSSFLLVCLIPLYLAERFSGPRIPFLQGMGGPRFTTLWLATAVLLIVHWMVFLALFLVGKSVVSRN